MPRSRSRRRRFGNIGIKKVIVPDLSGLTKSQAEATLSASGLSWTETPSTTSDININLNIVSQGIAAGTTVLIGSQVPFTYYDYVAPPNFNPGFAVPDPPQNSSVSSSSWNGSTVTISGSFPTLPTNIAVNGTNIGSWNANSSQITFSLSGTGSRTIQIYNGRVPLIPEFGISYDPNPGFANPGFASPDFANPGFANPGFAEPDFANPGFAEPDFTGPAFYDITLTSLDLSALFDFGGGGGKSVGISTLVRTTDGLVKAGDLKVGDQLLSANIQGFPYESVEGATQAAINWSDNNPEIIPEVTTIVNLYRTQSPVAVVINEDIFSQYHYILIKRDGISKFETSVNIVPETDLIYSYENSSWEPIYLYEAIPVAHDIISINCEPYDMFFTERMLTHDSSAV